MRPDVIIKFSLVVSLSCLLWSCVKKDDHCDPSVKPVVTTNSPLQAGDSLRLSVRGVSDIFIYNWHGPNGFSSHDSAPVLPGATSASNGKYFVDVITNGGCIYSATTDSVQVGAASLPCSLTNEKASLSGVVDINFYYVAGSPGGGSFFLTGNGDAGDAQFEFPGTGVPPTGIYSVQALGGLWGPGYVRVSFNDGFSSWDGAPGTVYVSVSNNKITVSSCNTHFYSSTYGYSTTGSFQLTQQ